MSNQITKQIELYKTTCGADIETYVRGTLFHNVFKGYFGFRISLHDFTYSEIAALQEKIDLLEESDWELYSCESFFKIETCIKEIPFSELSDNPLESFVEGLLYHETKGGYRTHEQVLGNVNSFLKLSERNLFKTSFSFDKGIIIWYSDSSLN